MAQLNILTWITELSEQILETLSQKWAVTYLTTKPTLSTAVAIRKRFTSIIDILTDAKKQVDERIAELLFDAGDKVEVEDPLTGATYTAAIQTRKGSERVNVDVVKTYLLEHGIPPSLVTKAFKEGTTIGEPSSFVVVREKKEKE